MSNDLYLDAFSYLVFHVLDNCVTLNLIGQGHAIVQDKLGL